MKTGFDTLPAMTPSSESYRDLHLRAVPTNIPEGTEWRELPVAEHGDPLIPIGPFSDNPLFTTAVYYGEHSNSPYPSSDGRLKDSLITMFARRETVRMLQDAQSLLPPRHYLVVFDSYRSFEVQQTLYNQYYDPLQRQHPDWSAEQLAAETRKYVSLPSRDPSKPSPHNTGGAIDLAIFTLPEDVDVAVRQISDRMTELKTIAPKDYGIYDEATNPTLRELYVLEMQKLGLIRRHAEMLDFGTPFDHGGPQAALAYFEELGKRRPLTPSEMEARDNRRLLYSVMTQAGMQPYRDEWWHYNAPESQMGAWVAGENFAEYGSQSLEGPNAHHEAMRGDHYKGVVWIHRAMLRGIRLAGRSGDPLIRLNEEALWYAGDPRHIVLPPAEKIAPPEV